MTIGVILGVLAAIVAASTAAWFVLRARSGRARALRPEGALVPADLDVAAHAFGAGGTVVQFSTAFCAQCPGTRRLLTEIVEGAKGIAYVDVDLTDRLDLAERFHVLSTPTVLVLDADGVPTVRFTGPPRRADVLASLVTA